MNVTVFILLFLSGFSEAFLGAFCSIPNQRDEEIGKKGCVLWWFEEWSSDAEVGKKRMLGQRRKDKRGRWMYSCSAWIPRLGSGGARRMGTCTSPSLVIAGSLPSCILPVLSCMPLLVKLLALHIIVSYLLNPNGNEMWVAVCVFFFFFSDLWLMQGLSVCFTQL